MRTVVVEGLEWEVSLDPVQQRLVSAMQPGATAARCRCITDRSLADVLIVLRSPDLQTAASALLADTLRKTLKSNEGPGHRLFEVEILLQSTSEREFGDFFAALGAHGRGGSWRILDDPDVYVIDVAGGPRPGLEQYRPLTGWTPSLSAHAFVKGWDAALSIRSFQRVLVALLEKRPGAVIVGPDRPDPKYLFTLAELRSGCNASGAVFPHHPYVHQLEGDRQVEDRGTQRRWWQFWKRP